MNNLTNKEFQNYFALKPLTSAKVSEISEKTASSPVPVSEKVNFHIGNPVQDDRLIDYYLKSIIGISSPEEIKTKKTLEKILLENDYDPALIPQMLFLYDALKNSVSYLPGGGYNVKNPNELIKFFSKWTVTDQQDQIDYDISTKGKRECIITSGGINESMRVFLFALSKYFKNLPTEILFWNFDLPEYLQNLPGLNYRFLSQDENVALQELVKLFDKEKKTPVFLILGRVLSEGNRRLLRKFSLSNPIVIIEVNDAPNNLSMAREARMKERVIRFLTPGIFSPRFANLSTVFVAGNSDFIKIIETLHFQLLGTPSGSEAELVAFLVNNPLFDVRQNNLNEYATTGGKIDMGGIHYSGLLNNLTDKAEATSLIIEDKVKRITQLAEKYSGDTEKYSEKIQQRISGYLWNADEYSLKSTGELIGNFFNSKNHDFYSTLEKSFVNSFSKHNPEYKISETCAVSGSARTALGLLGFHCGIEEVIIPDLSWTYEHCFKKVKVVPLKEGLKLDDQAIINEVEKKILRDPEWKNRGAVVINNPHNATGKIFPERKLINLIKFLFTNGVRLIDDLSYQNVAPVEGKLEIAKTLKQIAVELAVKGHIHTKDLKYLITVHSLSKTDCFAGARLSIINIPDEKLYARFQAVKKNIRPNITAILMAYLFYRNSEETVKGFWKLRNKIFSERMQGILEAADSIPDERNFFNILIEPPVGSMYPRLVIEKLPAGLSLDWLASGLASQGIGMIPLSAFARTAKGFELGRKTFRLTLGGIDDGISLQHKVRRLLIDLNRLIAEESAKYNLTELNSPFVKTLAIKKEKEFLIANVIKQIETTGIKFFNTLVMKANKYNGFGDCRDKFTQEYLPQRADQIRQILFDSLELKYFIEKRCSEKGSQIKSRLEKEFFKDDPDKRIEKFKQRLYDRTVHPTQMFALKVDLAVKKIKNALLAERQIEKEDIKNLSREIVNEFLGENVAIKSIEESDELIADLDMMNETEAYFNLMEIENSETFLSYWGDWDGSNRPSGQGHRLVAAVIVENVNRQAEFLFALKKANKKLKINENLLQRLDRLPEDNKRFWALLNKITRLTNQLEKRFKSLLPFEINISRLRKFGMKLSLASDPVTQLWQHNDSLEKRMLELRKKRSRWMQNYFELNKELRKVLFSLSGEIEKNLTDKSVLRNAALYKNLLKRFVLTPRIHQKLITSKDQFAIDTTVQNIIEINEIAGQYGNPGMVMALQVSMSNDPEALISLDRKINAKREETRRKRHGLAMLPIWIIPLFEDIESVNNIENYLNKVWEYSVQSRKVNQEPADRFTEIICEIFIAGSDLSQQIGQTASALLYKNVKFRITKWLAEKGLVDKVRMKLGSGEPMQRQGGYYNPMSGLPAFKKTDDNISRLAKRLKESTLKSTEYAKTPLLGVVSSGDLRTFQSNIAEQLRYIPIGERATLINQVSVSQKRHREDLIRAAEPFTETRLKFKSRGLHELERLTAGFKSEMYEEFVKLATDNFRNILYGTDEDVVGLHLISYFISRTTPTLRDRPTIRPTKENGSGKGQKILSNIARTIPMNRQGSSLRAIGHNRAQSVILGVNQLTTGLFRAMTQFSEKYSSVSDRETLITDIILPNLPVYEMLHTLRIYQDKELKYLNEISFAFPAGNSAFLKLREDTDAIEQYRGLLQKELLRRQGIETYEFFSGDNFRADLLPTLRPDIAVLLQPDFFNTSYDNFIIGVDGVIDENWATEVKNLLKTRCTISDWRAEIWKLLSIPIYQQVASFVELAVALNSLATGQDPIRMDLGLGSTNIKINQDVVNLLKGGVDDSMRQFLQAAVQYLTSLPQGGTDIPVDIVRALKDVERILKVEEQALTPVQQKQLNFYLLQIARVSGENG